ncbi:MAG: hypothetical protein ABWY93_24200 [Mycobacterium sp.]
MADRCRRRAFSAVVAAAVLLPIAVPPTARADECPAGQAVDGYTGQCVLDIEPISFMDAPEGIIIHTGPNYSGGQVPSVNGIPCTPEHYATCIGMGYNQVPHSSPQSTISHSP